MKNPAPYIRRALVELLTGISYQGQDVPVYSGDAENVPYQIVIKEQTGRGADNRGSRNTDFEQLIEVVSRQETNLNKHVDSIGSQVLDLLLPDVHTQGLLGNDDFQVMTIRRDSQSYLYEQSAAGTFINRLIIRISFLIVEK